MVTTLLRTINMLSSSIPYIIHKTLYTMRKTINQVSKSFADLVLYVRIIWGILYTDEHLSSHTLCAS